MSLWALIEVNYKSYTANETYYLIIMILNISFMPILHLTVLRVPLTSQTIDQGQNPTQKNAVINVAR